MKLIGHFEETWSMAVSELCIAKAGHVVQFASVALAQLKQRVIHAGSNKAP